VAGILTKRCTDCGYEYGATHGREPLMMGDTIESARCKECRAVSSLSMEVSLEGHRRHSPLQRS
jgi:hypothetical protein